MKIMGIDPGNKGALFVIENGRAIHDLIMPIIDIHMKDKTKHELDSIVIREYFKQIKPDHVFLEKAQAMNKTGEAQGSVSIWSYACGYGIIKGLLIGLDIPHTLIHPKTWQAKLFRDMSKDDTKAMSYTVASRIFPYWSFLATDRCKKFHSGLTDSALLAWYGWLIMSNQGVNNEQIKI